MDYTIMRPYSNPYLKTLRKRRFKSPRWIDTVLIYLTLCLFSFVSSYLGSILASGEIEVYLSTFKTISSSTPQILPNYPIPEATQDKIFNFYKNGVASYYDYSLSGDEPGREWSKTHDTCATPGWNRYGLARVTNLDNGKSVVCYINDDGPRDCEWRYAHNFDKPGTCIERDIDLSSHAFKQIADPKLGLISVKIEYKGEFSTFKR